MWLLNLGSSNNICEIKSSYSFKEDIPTFMNDDSIEFELEKQKSVNIQTFKLDLIAYVANFFFISNNKIEKWFYVNEKQNITFGGKKWRISGCRSFLLNSHGINYNFDLEMEKANLSKILNFFNLSKNKQFLFDHHFGDDDYCLFKINKLNNLLENSSFYE